ncbi:Hypothetical protein NTJ_13265 [Nesidiocoris tenuis]|uniref:C3H1-type domain-containing protein n=1 Tax=Nesidiocoris tenuis TaxID=355587 RepID=A0ABN7B888_9HEMI|nr:Hypothetical protein NTJ_13265 [Nesidiocoris tenuis]
MSKTSKRKSTETGKTSDTIRSTSTVSGSSTSSKELPNTSSQSASSFGVKRPSVFDRLGTKAASSRSSIERSLSVNTASSESYCRSWAQNGTCSYDKSCKFAHSHALISPSKRSASGKKETDLHVASSVLRRQLDDEKGRLLSSGKHQSPEVSTWENWDQTELEYEDEKVLEKRRAALQRELELQMKKEGSSSKKITKASRSSSTSSVSSSSASSSTSTSSSSISAAKKFNTRKRCNSSSSAESDTKKPNSMKSSSHKDSPARNSSSSVRDASRKPRSSGNAAGTSPPRRKRSGSRKSSPKSKTSASDYKGITLEVTLKNDLALRGNPKIRRDSPVRQSGSADRRNRRSNSRGRRRTPPARASVPRRSRPRSPRPTTSSRVRTPERKKEDIRKKDDRRGRKGAYREKKDTHDDPRNRVKARELREREMAREKERLEALERCRERQRERELKEKERLRDDRDRKDTKRRSREMPRPSVPMPDKRHDRVYDKFDRGKGSERERSYERERVRDRGLERVLDRKSLERGGRERSRSRFGDRPPYESRRIIQPDDKNYSSSPYRGADKSRYEGERDRLSPRDDRLNRSNYEDRRDRDRGRNWAGDRQQPSQSSRYDEPNRDREKPSRSSGGADWSNDRGSDFQDASSSRSRDWESSRIRDEGSDDWSGYDRAGGGDWHGNRQLPHHRAIDDRRNLRRGSGSKDKEVHPPIDTSEKELDNSGKRPAECDEIMKKPRQSEPPALDNVSDISDDPDDILNRDDIEFTEGEDSRLGESSQNALGDASSGQGERAEGPTDDSALAHSPRPGDDENMVGLDFEEISDEELEEEKMNKGGSIGDALGVDWLSLIADCPEKKKVKNGDRSSVRARWEAGEMLARLGVSTTLASPEYIKKLKEKYPEILPGGAKDESTRKIMGVAALQRKLAERKARRENVIALSMENKQALSARADIAIRRRICGLPVVSLETHTTTGFCPWAL